MKLILKLAAVIWLYNLDHAIAQKKTGELIPIILHSYKIDSLLSKIISTNGWVVSKDSIFIIRIENAVDKSLFLSIHSYDKNEANKILVSAHFEGWHIGYFTLKKLHIFTTSATKFVTLFWSGR